MKHCPNDNCIDLVDHDVRGEYQLALETCPRCAARLADGPVPPRTIETNWADTVCIATFTHVANAYLAKSMLEAAGLWASVENDQLSGVQWLYTSAVGGVRLCVSPDEVDEAKRLLAGDASSETVESLPHADSRPDGECCPVCGAEGATPSRLGFKSRALSLLSGIPFVVWKRSMECKQCGNKWKPGQ